MPTSCFMTCSTRSCGASAGVVKLLIAGVVLALAQAELSNMNGQYYIQNGNSTASGLAPVVPFNTSFASYPSRGRADNPVQYVEAYSEEISTVYSQVWWTMGPLFRFPETFIRAYDDKTMAIVGYEFDQVMTNPDGTET